jgi:4-amino-4-deoxy-L-arabinose transferase-like glycosyltransferase
VPDRSFLATHRALLAVLLLALLIRLALWAQPLHEPANDEVEYITVAYDLLAGRGWQFYEQYHWLRAPLYPLFLAASLWLSGGNLHLAALPNIVLSVATVGLIYALTTELVRRPADADKSVPQPAPGGSHAPILAALLAAVLLTLGTFASLYMSETLFAFLLIATVLLLVRWQHRATPGAPHLGMLLLAAVCYGLATLTRSLPLAFLPVVLLWLLVGSAGSLQGLWPAGWLRALRAPVLFAAVVLLTIAPWTLRNCQAYGSCILVETGFSYNMWAFNEPRESMGTIFRTLEQIPNPAERADEATQRGMQRLQEDPAILLRKLWPNWGYLWRIKPIQDRFLMSTYYADPPAPLFLAALVFDDLLYVLILVLGIIGLSSSLATRQRATGVPGVLAYLRAPPVLIVLWIAYVVVATLLTHGEPRYRHFLFPLLIPYAAIGTIGMQQFARRAWQDRRSGSTTLPRPDVRTLLRWAAHLALIGLLLHPVWTQYPWQWAAEGAERSTYRIVGDVAYQMGNLSAAEAAYRRALQGDKTADVYMALGGLYLQQGDLSAAEAAFWRAWRHERHYIAANARYGDILRRQSRQDEARRAFVGFYVSEQEMLNWSWRHLDPPPKSRIDIGGGLDFGYVGGMYPDEQQQGAHVRWTNGHGLLRLSTPADSSGPVVLHLRVAAPRPAAPPEDAGVLTRICVQDECQQVQVAQSWRIVSLLLPASSQVQPGAGDAEWHTYTVELHSPTLAAPDGRTLGVLVDWAAVSYTSTAEPVVRR